MDLAADPFPIWVIVIDYVMGAAMWTLIGRFGMNIFLPETSNFFFMKFFVRVTNPLLRCFAPITPKFLLRPMVPLYVAWFFYMFRFYLMPLFLGYSTFGMLSFPLESDIARIIYDVYNNLRGYF
ncbi:hypothetical protein NQX30_04490 [Candidatus Persebacteraceae bacterium Df01]|jgi:hypothetical protein|uniref:YGGT family protein n=1 Tax=Candidatus Doriopsillibacter californiensis TaxID=2970740 RepID=A0ABT7QLM8_9GAMM|nr:hypothetical protein [Candidatus Persebacteraceae bacterium Df01]